MAITSLIWYATAAQASSPSTVVHRADMRPLRGGGTATSVLAENTPGKRRAANPAGEKPAADPEYSAHAPDFAWHSACAQGSRSQGGAGESNNCTRRVRRLCAVAGLRPDAGQDSSREERLRADHPI